VFGFICIKEDGMDAPRRFDIKPMDGNSWAITLFCAAVVLITALDSKIAATIPIALIILLVMTWFRPLTLEEELGTFE